VGFSGAHIDVFRVACAGDVSRVAPGIVGRLFFAVAGVFLLVGAVGMSLVVDGVCAACGAQLNKLCSASMTDYVVTESGPREVGRKYYCEACFERAWPDDDKEDFCGPD